MFEIGIIVLLIAFGFGALIILLGNLTQKLTLDHVEKHLIIYKKQHGNFPSKLEDLEGISGYKKPNMTIKYNISENKSSCKITLVIPAVGKQPEKEIERTVS